MLTLCQAVGRLLHLGCARALSWGRVRAALCAGGSRRGTPTGGTTGGTGRAAICLRAGAGGGGSLEAGALGRGGLFFLFGGGRGGWGRCLLGSGPLPLEVAVAGWFGRDALDPEPIGWGTEVV